MTQPGSPATIRIRRLPAVKQHSLVVLTDIIPDGNAGLRQVLARIDANPFFQLIPTVHFAAFVMLPEFDCTSPRLVLESNFDGDCDEQIAAIVQAGGTDLDEVYKHCKGYPANGTLDHKKKYLKDHSCPASAYFVALPGRSVEDIGNAGHVYRASRRFVDTLPRAPGPAGQIWEELKKAIRGRAQDHPLWSPTTQRRLWWRVALGLPILIPLAIVILAILLLLTPVTRHYEKRIARLPVRPRWPEDIYARYPGLNRGPQNHICTIATVRNDAFHRFMLRMALFSARILANNFFILGTLDTIRTIHFARWTMIDGGKRILFLSNYDGAWSSYLNEFEDPPHLNSIWSNTQNFPPTKYLLWGGARDAARFEDHFISEFYSAQVFYSAYREYSVQNLLRYVDLRDTLAREI